MMEKIQNMVNDFLETCDELLDNITGDIMDLEKRPDTEIIHRIYRAFHSIKGDAHILGLNPLVSLASKGEDVLSLLKNGAMELNGSTVDGLFHSLDRMKLALENIRCGIPANEPPSITKDSKSLPSFQYPLKILIVEDDFTCRTILMEFLSKFGQCHVAKDGLEAIWAFTLSYEHSPVEPYDLICMDIIMPRMDGSKACKTIREIERGKGIEGTEDEAAIIMITGLDDPRNYVKACYESGADSYMVKPIDLLQLKQQMRSLNLIG
jgi:two-component system, chemotaxis family, chemotaxis protein CheY